MSDIALVSNSFGILAIVASIFGLTNSIKTKEFIYDFPRSIWAGRILAAICCILAAWQAYVMNMGGLNQFKALILLIAPIVFICMISYLKELLAARSLGGLLCLLAVPLINLSVYSEKPYFQIIVFIGYSWVIFGIILLMAPWQFRKMNDIIMKNSLIFKLALYFKGFFGIALILVALYFY